MNRSFNKKEVAKILILIALTEVFAESSIMWTFEIFHKYLGSPHENFTNPILLVLFTSPIIAYFIIYPYVKSRDAFEQSAKEAHAKNEALLLEQKASLAEKVKKATRDLRKSQERYALASEGSNDGLWDWDLKKNKIFFSKRWKGILGYKDSEFPNTPGTWLKHIHPDDYIRFSNLIDASKNSQEVQHFECEYRMKSKKGQEVWVLARWICAFKKGKVVRLVGSHSNISRRKHAEVQMLHDAVHDALTGLPNRLLLMDRLEQSFFRYKRNPIERFSLLFLDLQNFKRINDTLGHHTGDQLLIEISKRLQKILRASDTLARIGADEFVLLLHETKSKEEMENLIPRIREAIGVPFQHHTTVITPSISVGGIVIDTFHRDSTPQDIMIDGDITLHQAKKDMNHGIAFFDASLRNSMTKQFEISNLLSGAVKRGEIQLFYQPVVNIKTGKIGGFEALMRWHHPKHGWVPPSYFIPLAEESEVIHELGEFALNHACAQLASWNKMFKNQKWFVSINFSGRQFERDTSLHILENALKKYKITPSQIKLEVTETILATHAQRASWMLSEFKKKGVLLALDDFGVGYSSLSTLYTFPFDTLKVDRSFLLDLSHNPKSRGMMAVVQTLAEMLQMNTVVEGVETKDQLKFVKDIKCDYIQGYYFSKPESFQDMTERLLTSQNPQDWVEAQKNEKKTPKRSLSSEISLKVS